MRQGFDTRTTGVAGAWTLAAGVGLIAVGLWGRLDVRRGDPGGGLPIYLALPFLAAMLDLARRVALQRATWPSGHPWRIPDTPG